MDEKKKRKDKKICQAGDMSFPASNATAHGKPTSTATSTTNGDNWTVRP